MYLFFKIKKQMTKVLRYITSLALGSCFVITSSTPVLSEEDVLINPRHYECTYLSNKWTTIVTQNYKTLKFIEYASKDFLKSGWSPQTRCRQISRKLELNERNDNLEFFVPGYFNGMEVVCASKIAERKNLCLDEEVLLTVLPGQSADKVIQHFNDFMIKTAIPPLAQSPKTLVTVRRNGESYNVLDVNRAIYLLKD
jgi:Circadian oscillating protein COP23